MSTSRITFIGHASVVVQLEGLTLMLNPHFGQKALFRKRQRPLTLMPKDFPEPDAILINQVGYSHLDLHSFKYFSSTMPVIVPLGLTQFIGPFIRNPVIELGDYATLALKNHVVIHQVPVSFRGRRLLGFRNQASCGYVIEGGGQKILMTGDTAPESPLDQVTERHKIDVAMLPISPIQPRFLKQSRFLNPDTALQLSERLQARTFIPTHWGSFRRGWEKVNKPKYELQTRLSQTAYQGEVVILEPGEAWDMGVQ